MGGNGSGEGCLVSDRLGFRLGGVAKGLASDTITDWAVSRCFPLSFTGEKGLKLASGKVCSTIRFFGRNEGDEAHCERDRGGVDGASINLLSLDKTSAEAAALDSFLYSLYFAANE
jgi:hypothetical protein